MKKKTTWLLAGLLALSLAGCGTPATLEEPVTNADSSVAEVSSAQEDAQPSGDAAEPSSGESDPIPETYLKELFAEHGMKVGTCLTPQMISNTKQSQLILDQFNSVTMENAMKPDYIFSKKDSASSGDLVVEFNSDMVKMLNWAKANNMSVRGHTLVWYSQTPEWIFHEDFDLKKGLVGRDVMLSRMESYIRQIFEKLETEGYADLFYAYDVVNEAWLDDGSMRENNWSKTIGDDYLWQAFYFADKYAPESIDLYYNDYNEQFKTDALIDFVDSLTDDDGNYLIDGIGLQAHLYTKDDLKAYFECVDALGATGLKLELTELDVSLGAWQNTLNASDENLRTQGKFYYDLVNGLFERADAGTIRMDALTFWGFSDGLSWRKDASPLLYDKNMTPKYSYYGAMQMKELAGF